jgi:beta-lactamase regulating signal transducer with metallopeptidase domain
MILPLGTAAAAAAPAATVSPSSETVRHTAADAATPATTASSSSETASAPAAAAITPTVTHRAGSLSLLISFVVLVIVLGTLVPLLLRWRKRKTLERAGAQNLSFTNEASSDPDKPELRKVA